MYGLRELHQASSQLHSLCAQNPPSACHATTFEGLAWDSATQTLIGYTDGMLVFNLADGTTVWRSCLTESNTATQDVVKDKMLQPLSKHTVLKCAGEGHVIVGPACGGIQVRLLSAQCMTPHTRMTRQPHFSRIATSRHHLWSRIKRNLCFVCM